MKNIIEDVLEYIDINYTKYNVEKLFNEHPHNGDMYGVKDMLKQYGIESVGIESKEKQHFEFQMPSIFYYNKKFILGIDCSKDIVTYISNGKKRSIDRDNFTRMWDGNALVITSTENAKETGYFQHLCLELITKLSWLLLIIIPGLLMIYKLMISYSFEMKYFIPLIFLNVLGCLICLFLIKNQLHWKNKIEDKFCSMLSEKGCDAVLTSNQSTILYIFSWSEIGLSFFVVNLMMIIFFNQFISGLMIITYLAMPFGIWSVWYQAQKVRKWCTLCLSTQFIIWALGIYYIVMNYFGYFNISNIFTSLVLSSLCMIFMLINVHYLIKCISDQFNISLMKQKLSKFQVDNDVLKAKYIKQENFSDSSNFSTILFGNPSSSYQLTILSNPKCHHCADLHKKIDKLLRNGDMHIGIRFIFISFATEFNDICKMLIAARQQLDESIAANIFSLWFNNPQSNPEELINRFSLDISNEKVNSEYSLHVKWALDNHLNKTPVVLVNGYIIPDPYEIEDIENMEEI